MSTISSAHYTCTCSCWVVSCLAIFNVPVFVFPCWSQGTCCNGMQECILPCVHVHTHVLYLHMYIIIHVHVQGTNTYSWRHSPKCGPLAYPNSVHTTLHIITHSLAYTPEKGQSFKYVWSSEFIALLVVDTAAVIAVEHVAMIFFHLPIVMLLVWDAKWWHAVI